MKVMITGSFDPVTVGHLDIIKRASVFFSEVVVAILVNEHKQSIFSTEERMQFINDSVMASNLLNVTVVSDTGLAVDCARKLGCSALIRGVRTSNDYEYEANQAIINNLLDGGIETLFFVASPQYANISSSMVRTIASLGGPLKPFVPEHVERALRLKFPVLAKGIEL